MWMPIRLTGKESNNVRQQM